MASEPDESVQTRIPLSRDRVLRAAIDLADRSGIEALTMRKLAVELGVEAMSLYYYVARKDDILDGIVDMVMGEIELPADRTDWKAALRATAITAHRTLMRHPWACSLILSRSGLRPGRMRYMDSILGTLREAGFSAAMTHHAYHALDSHIVGFTLWLVGMALDTVDLADVGAAFLRDLPIDEYPFLAEHVQGHLTGFDDTDKTEFEFGLDLILDGLERIRHGA